MRNGWKFASGVWSRRPIRRSALLAHFPPIRSISDGSRGRSRVVCSKPQISEFPFVPAVFAGGGGEPLQSSPARRGLAERAIIDSVSSVVP